MIGILNNKPGFLTLFSLISLSLMFSVRGFANHQTIASLSANIEQGGLVAQPTTDTAKTGFEIGALIFLGADLHFFHRPGGSPWMAGFRYLKTDFDFIFGEGDDSDQETLTISGPFVRHLYAPGRRETFYLSAAIYEMTQKVDCPLGSDEDSATSLFFGGGLMGWRDQPISYNIGILMAPGLSLATDTGDCSSETNGGIDVNASFMFSFD